MESSWRIPRSERPESVHTRRAEEGAHGVVLWRGVCPGVHSWAVFLPCMYSAHDLLYVSAGALFTRPARVPAREVFNPPPVPPGSTPVPELCPGDGWGRGGGGGVGTCVATPGSEQPQDADGHTCRRAFQCVAWAPVGSCVTTDVRVYLGTQFWSVGLSVLGPAPHDPDGAAVSVEREV